MAINERLIDTEVAAAGNGGTGTGNQEEGLILHLDANDVDSYDGDGTEWVDITNHEYTPSTDVSEHFNTVLYTGNGTTNSTEQNITGVGFQPDLVWIKNRDETRNHVLVDSLRKTGNLLDELHSNLTDAANTTGTDNVKTMDSDGFTVLGQGSETNDSGDTFVAWCFKAGGTPSGSDKVSIDGTSYSTMSAANLTNGTISVHKLSVNTNLGFSIVSYNGNQVSNATVAHGLGVNAELIIVKNLESAVAWAVWTTGISDSQVLRLEQTDAAETPATAYFEPQNNTSNFFSLGTNDETNHNDDYIAYCFASKRGVSKVGSYVGNGTTDNKIVTGFQPAFVMLKNTSRSNTRWIIMDNARDPDNTAYKVLSPNYNAVEDTSTSYWLLDWERDGFRLKYGADNEFNRNGDKYIYYAVAKNTNETSLIPIKDSFTAGSVETTNLEVDLDANDYSGSGNWLDSSGNSNDGVITGATYVNDGSADYFDLDGSSDKITFGSSAITAFNSNNRTVEFWFKSDDLSATKVIFIADGSGYSYGRTTIITTSAGNIQVMIGDNGSYPNVSISANTWYHFAVSKSGTSYEAFLDGESIGTAIANTWNDTAATQLKVSGNLTSTYPFNGQVGQLRLYSTNLSQTQIKSNYEATRIYNTPDLKLHLDAASFPEKGESGYSNTPSTWTDSSGNSNNGTIAGATFDSELGNYLNFDGINDMVTTSYDIPSVGAKTIEFWFNDNGSSGTNSTYPSPVGGSNAAIWTGGDLTGSYSDESLGFYNADTLLHFYIRTGTNTYRDNKWHHVAITDNGSNQHAVYVDGESHSISYLNGSSSSRISMNNVQIGKGRSTPTTGSYSYYFNGQVGQVRIYSSALTQDQVRQNYNFTKPNYPNGFDGDISGATWNSAGYFQFDGSNDEIDLTSSHPYSSNDVQTNSVKSITGWVKLDSGTRAMLYSISSTANSNYYFTCQVRNDSNGVFMQCRDGGTTNSFIDKATNSAPDSNWHHYVFQLDGDERQIYIDGVKKTLTKDNRGTATDSSWISYPTYSSSAKHKIQKGREISAYYGTGKVSKVKHYTRPLTQEEITALYNEGE